MNATQPLYRPANLASYRQSQKGLVLAEAALQQAERNGWITRSLTQVTPSERGFDFLSDLQALFLPEG